MKILLISPCIDEETRRRHPLFYLALNILSRQICKGEIRRFPRTTARLSRWEAR